MADTEKYWKLNSPEVCRDFLKSLRFGPKQSRITCLKQDDGRELTIDEAPDDQVMEVANNIAQAHERVQSRKK